MQVTGCKLGWVVVKDLDKAIAFYKDVVGLELTQHTPQMGWAEMSGEDGARIGLAVQNDDQVASMGVKAGDNAIMCIGVKNMEEAVAHYKEKGANLIGDVVEVPGHIKMQTFNDQDGNTFQLVCEL